MKKALKRLLGLVMCLALLLCIAAPASAAAEEKTPFIIIPGFTQSYVDVLDENGNYVGKGNTVDFGGLDIKGLILKNILPLLTSVISRSNRGLSDVVGSALEEVLKTVSSSEEAKAKYTRVVHEYNVPYSQLSEEDLNEIHNHVVLDIDGYEDMYYYFAYDSFGSVKEAADRLHTFMHDVVLSQTGASKVSLVPLSQGGCVLTEYLDLYPEDHQYIKKIIGFVPAFDGSEIVGEVLCGNLTIYDLNKLHGQVIPAILGDNDTSYLISIALRVALSKKMQTQVINAAVATIIKCLANSSMIWALCPSGYYEQARQMNLQDAAHDELRAENDRFDLARKNLSKNLQGLIDSGVIVHIIVCYDKPYMFADLFTCAGNNSDDLLPPSSPSLGATAAKLGETLGDNYVSPKTHCSNPNHNHISPDNVIDASTGFLPENTWYFKGVLHDKLNLRDDVKRFAMELLLNDSIVDIYTFPEHSQFTDPANNIDHSVVNEDGTISHFDKYGNHLYNETPASPSKPSGISIWKLLYKAMNIFYKIIDLGEYM